jgi:MATE family multidrug resistance protein
MSKTSTTPADDAAKRTANGAPEHHGHGGADVRTESADVSTDVSAVRARTVRSELRVQLKLALPIVAVQLGMMLMGVVDTIMVGHYGSAGASTRALAAVSQGNLLFWGGMTFAIGIMMGLDPVLSQALGAGDRRGFARGVQRGFVLVPLLTLVAGLPLVFSPQILALLEQPQEVREIAVQYALLCLPGLPFVLAYSVLRQSLQALERLAPILWTVLIANLLNVFLDWVLIHGKFGMPALGAAGSAVASTACRVWMFGALLALVWDGLLPLVRPLERASLALAPLGRLLRLGSSIGAQNLLEFGSFALVAFAMGWIGTNEQAGHMAAMNLAAVTFMVPLGVGAAASVRVGKAIGRGDASGARLAARTALVIGVGFMCTSAVAFVAFPGFFAALYSEEAAVVAIATTLLPLAGAFQLFDGTQVVALGVLRGAGDTTVPAYVNFLGYWVIGLPVSYVLAFELGVGYTGLWWGLVVGLVVVAAILLLRIKSRFASLQARVSLDR